jgi:hypothetical protein
VKHHHPGLEPRLLGCTIGEWIVFFFLRIDPIVAIVDPDDPFQEEIPS